MAAYNAVVYAAANYGTGSAAKRVNIWWLLAVSKHPLNNSVRGQPILIK